MFLISGCSGSRGTQGEICNQPQELSTLSGSYKSISKVTTNLSGTSITSTLLELTVDGGGHIRASKSWKSASGYGHKSDGSKTQGDTELLIGVVKDCEFALVEMDESGILLGKLLNNGNIKMTFVQSGIKPVAYIEELSKAN